MRRPMLREIVADKYRLVRVLGEGAMGVVYEAQHLELGSRVAIKFIREEALLIPATLQRFEREARAAAKLRNNHVARVMDVGKMEGGLPFMVMDYLVGQSLVDVLAKRGQLPVGEAVDLILQALSGMAEAHSHGVVHRDLKPGNLFLVHDGSLGELKIIDFGVAMVASEVRITSTSSQLGTPLYMSPEQVRSPKSVDARTDIWSLGMVLFELITGESAYAGHSPSATVAAITTDPVPALDAYYLDVPPSFQTVLEGALAKDREQRYASVFEFARALLPFADHPAMWRPSHSLPPALLCRRKVSTRRAESPTLPALAGNLALAFAK